MSTSTEKTPATGSRGMVVTNHPLGSAAGTEMIAAGGNAFDAGIASLFALTVVEPMMVGIFGAGMSNARLANGTFDFVNNYAVAPAAATPDMYRTMSDTWPGYQEVVDQENDVGPLAVGVPGSLAGWCELLERHGTLSLEDVLQPAIRYAERGFVTTPYLSGCITLTAEAMARFPETARTFMPEGTPLAAGDRCVQGEYADTLRLIAASGPNVLYHGELGRAASDYLQSIGGIITTCDLASYATNWCDVVRGTYRGAEIIGPPPPSAGGIQVIEMLNILSAWNLKRSGSGTAETIHLLAETLKVGFEDRKEFTGDPAFVDVPIEMLTSMAYAGQRRALIDPNRARTTNAMPISESNNTTHLTTADNEGNVFAGTHTLHALFGSKVTVPGTGMILNNTMNIFDPHPGLANSIAPGKRMTSSMSPIIVQRDGAPWFALGLPGATKIFPSAMQAIINMIDHDMTPQQAVEAPRVWTQGQELELEAGFEPEVVAALAALGHETKAVRAVGGGMNMITFDGGTLTGAACWRADGMAMGIGGGTASAGSRFDI